MANKVSEKEDITKAVDILCNSGVMARTDEEKYLLEVFRAIKSETDKRYGLGVLAGLSSK